MSEDGDRTCPLCAEEMDLTDQQLKPCKCGYEICVWCWHHIVEMAEKEGSEGRCPACRTPYDKQRIVAANCARMVAVISAEKKHKSQKTKNKTSSIEDRKHLSSVRVVQRSLVYIMGLPNSLADENILERKEYFGQYGKILKVSVTRPAGSTIQQASNNNTFNVYITYAREEEAIRCIQAVHTFVLEGKPLRACFGTTKYCYTWLRNMTCNNSDCLYLHDIGSQEDSFTKDEIISAYTRSRVPPISSNNLQPRAGNVFPPPVDDLSNYGAVSTKHSTKSLLNVKNPTDSSGLRSTALPAAASWGLRVSNCRPPASSNACSQNPLKQKTEVLNSSSSSPIVTSKIPEGKSTILEPLKHGEGKDSLIKVSDVPLEAMCDGHTSGSAWDDDITVTNMHGGKDAVHTNGRSRIIETSKPSDTSSEVVLDEALHSAWDDDTAITSNVYTDDRFRSPDTLEPGTGFSQTPASDFKAKSFADSSRTSSVSINCSSSQSSRQPENRSGGIPVSKVNTIQVNITNSRDADDPPHSAANRNTESLCLGLSSVNLDSDIGVDHARTDQNDHRLDGNLGNLNSRLQPSVLMSNGMELYPLDVSNHITNNSQNAAIVDKQFPHDANSIMTGADTGRDNESFLLNGHKEEIPSCFAEPQSVLGNASNIEKTENVDTGEKSIVSDIFSSDFDPWDDAWSKSNSFAKLLAQMNKQEGPSELSTTWDSQNTNQSRFSFARQENQANLGDSCLRDTSHSQSFSSKQEPYGNCFGSNFPINNFEGANALGSNMSTISSDANAGVTRAQISAPPGFSVPNRAPPPGFSSQDRYDLAFNTCSETQLLGSSLQNQFQDHSTGDVEFIDPAILAVGKGRLPLGVNNTVFGSRSSFHPQFPSTESDPPVQLLMQQYISSSQDPRIPNHIGDRFLQFDDAYIASRFPSQTPSNLSPFAQISHQQQPSHFLNSSQWDGWNDMAISNGMGGVADALRNQRFGLGSYFHVNEEPKFHLSSSGDLYNRAFGL